MVTCCKDCTSRHYKCHATCKTYIGAVEKADAEKVERIRKADGLRYDIERAAKIKRRAERRK